MITSHGYIQVIALFNTPNQHTFLSTHRINTPYAQHITIPNHFILSYQSLSTHPFNTNPLTHPNYTPMTPSPHPVHTHSTLMLTHSLNNTNPPPFSTPDASPMPPSPPGFNFILGLPIVFFGIQDRDLSAAFSLAHPEVYSTGRTNVYLTLVTQTNIPSMQTS